MTHNNLFVLYTAVILLTIRFYQTPKLWQAAAIGGIVGLATITRPTELMMGLIPVIWGIQYHWESIRQRFAFLHQHWIALLVAALAGGLFIALQPIYWHWATGDWIVYSYQDQGFSFLKPHIIDGLFSFRAGWLPYTPLGLLMLVGLIPLWRQHNRIAPAIITYLMLFMYITWAWDIWWYGGSLGQRSMVQVYPLLALGLAALLQTANQARLWKRLTIGAAFGICVLVSLFWTHQAHRGGMYIASQMTKRFYFAQLGRFDRPNERLKLLDRAYIYEGTPDNPKVVYESGFDAIESDFRCDGLAGFRDASLCLAPGIMYSPQIEIPNPAPWGSWMRLSAKVAVEPREGEVWAMAHLEVRFMKGDKKVRYYNLKPERLSYGKEYDVHFDFPVPDKAYDDIVFVIWRARANTYFSIDDLKVEAW
jgi:hypothetical protein